MLKWLINKPLSKLYSIITPQYSVQKYPRSVRAKCDGINSERKNSYVLEGQDIKGFAHLNKEDIEVTIPLASHVHKYLNIKWHERFVDQEDEMSLHRWNWLLNIISHNDYNRKQIVWASSQIDAWLILFSSEAKNNDKKTINSLRWSSYTVGERISNSILFHYITNTIPSFTLQESLFDQTIFLLKRLEYFGNRTSNHIINNSRALYLFGVAFDYKKSISIAKEIINNEFNKLIDSEGFLREGSSHYQFLFTRWILEIYFFSILADDLKFSELLKKKLLRLLHGCEYFYVYSDKTTRIIPFFGDISPDFSTSWLIDIDKSIFFDNVKNEEELVNYHSWNNLWINSRLKNNYILKSKNNLKNNIKVINEFPKSGWYRYNYGRFILFIRQDKNGFPPYVGHHHQDFGHFVLFVDNEEVIVDVGRKNYGGKNGVFPHFHNTITIDNIGVIPKYPHRYPHEYSQFSNTIKSKRLKEEIIILIGTNGLSRLKEKMYWNREFILKNDEFIICDNITGGNKGLVSSNFFWAEKFILTKERRNKVNFKSKVINGYFESNEVIYPQSELKIEETTRTIKYGGSIPCKLLNYRYNLNVVNRVQYKLKLL